MPDRAERDEPQQAHRAEQRADLRRAQALQREQAEQHQHRERQHPALEERRADLQALDRRHHRGRRRHHRLAEEQRRAEQAEQHHDAAQLRPVLERVGGEREQRHGAALAAVVGAHHQHHVFQRHHDDQRPEDQSTGRRGCSPCVSGMPCGRREGFLDRVQRAGADVAEHDAQRGEGQRGAECPFPERSLSKEARSYLRAAGNANSSLSLSGSPGRASGAGAGWSCRNT